MKNCRKRVFSSLLALALLMSNLPPVHVMAEEIEGTGLCEHHLIHEDCGYVEEVSRCGFTCGLCTQEPEENVESKKENEEAIVSTRIEEFVTMEELAVTEEPVPVDSVIETVTVQATPQVDLPDNAELFAGFAERELYGYEMATFGTAARASLSAIEQKIYDNLKTKIETVALSGGSTVFAVSGISGLKTTWTNTELGVTSIEDATAVQDAFKEQFTLSNITNALLTDCPFDLYWFDKTGGVSMSYQIGFGGYTQAGQTIWNLAEVENLEITFAVSVDYRAGSDTVTSNVSKVTRAKDNAAEVVAANESRTAVEKMKAYKEYICDAVSYDHDAADDKTTPYGDPWQLISVFDGDSSTNVVCEGYAKAFQYLCDLGGLECISVSGTMTGGTGSGGHMWNVVTLDGKNYLVDVTNCDEGTAGAPDKLFLVGAPYVSGSYSFNCGYQTISFLCSNLGLAEENYTETQQPDEPLTKYTVTVNASQNGTVMADLTTAVAGATVTLTVTPETGYALKSLVVKQGTVEVDVENNQFIMPAGDVTVTAEFEKITSGTCGDNLTWEFDETAGSLTISGTGMMSDFYSSTVPWKDYLYLITSIVVNEGAESIGNYAFANADLLKSASLAESVTRIGQYAFQDCTSLVNLSLPKYTDSIGYMAFDGCCSLRDVELPKGITIIENYAFSNCENLTAITIPEGVERIGNGAFSFCSALAEVKFSTSLKSIGERAFLWCDKLVSIELPSNVVSIEKEAFYSVQNVSYIMLPESVHSIGTKAFEKCYALSHVFYNGSEEQWKTVNIGSGNEYLTNAFIHSDVQDNYVSELNSCTITGLKCDICDICISASAKENGSHNHSNGYCVDCATEEGWEYSVSQKGIITIEKYNGKAKNLIIPDSIEKCVVKEIGHHAFDRSKIESIEMPDNITEIGIGAFYGSGLKRITLSANLTSISQSSFMFSSLEEIIIPKKIEAIGYSAFCGCTKLNAVTFEGNAPKIDNTAFSTTSLTPNVTATVYYPAGNKTWTEAVMQDYGGDLTWKPYCTGEHTIVEDAAVDATCTETGLTAGSHCSVCDEVLVKQETVKALGHKWTDADCDTAKTCSVCKATEGKPTGHKYDDNVDGTCNACGVNRESVETRKVVHMFRMYNPNTGEHFYTGSEVEKSNLIMAGWQYEGVGFTFPANTGAPVYRLFQESTGEHLYTMDETEKAKLEAEGWNYEGVAFNSAYDTEAVQHRLHNPNATVGAYHFTFSEEEKQNLINAGWEYQGIGWYSCWK